MKNRAFRNQVFSLMSLIGCIAPWVTPRHFPIHQFQEAQEPMLLSREQVGGEILSAQQRTSELSSDFVIRPESERLTQIR